MNCSEPEDDNESEVDDEDESEVDDENETAFVDEDYVVFDWARGQFPRKTTFMLFAIGFYPASPMDLVQLRIPKHDGRKQFLWTAAFFVKEGLSWYVYRKVLVVNRRITPAELPGDIFKILERNAYAQLQFMKRRKYHVLEYLEIVF